MCTAHACTRTALKQAFRTPNRRSLLANTVPDFLVPAITRPPCSSIPPNKPSHARRFASDWSSARSENSFNTSQFHQGVPKSFRQPCIPLPDGSDRGDIHSWLSAIDGFLPARLRRNEEAKDAIPEKPATSYGFSIVLNEAQACGHDLLSQLGMVEGRWDTVMWIVKKLMEDGIHSFEPPVRPESLMNIDWPGEEPRSLDALTAKPILAQRHNPPQAVAYSLDKATLAPNSIDPKHTVIKKALGQVWRSLGSLILTAAKENEPKGSLIMPHVLEIIAYLHHAGLIPDSVYTNRPVQDGHALQQPPTLHLLSPKILDALSDATWRAHEASATVAKERMNASYFMGREIPGSRYSLQVTGVAPELWLELVLWSCLHGGWVLDGTTILEQMHAEQGDARWKLISWRELLQKSEEETSSSHTWRLFGQRAEAAASKAKDRARTHHTISSELVTAFIDGLVSSMRVGVGFRGADPEFLLDHIKNLKKLLEANALSLGFANWDSIMVRLIESGGIIPEKRPELLLKIVELASGFGSEVAAANTPPKTAGPDAAPPYFFEPSATSISLLHRTLHSFTENGGISGAMTTLNTLQEFTDVNKQRSVEKFFEQLKRNPTQHHPDHTTLPVEFPAFDAQVPVPLLAKVLDLATDSKLFDLGRAFVYSDSLDGPLINHQMYGDLTMIPSLVRFGALAGENDLVMKIVKSTGTWNKKTQTQQLPPPLMVALLCSQIRLHRWESVKSMQEYMLDNPGYPPKPNILATFVAELIRLTGKEHADSREKACAAFESLLFAWEGIIMNEMRKELYSLLGILSSINRPWNEFTSQFLAFSSRQNIELSTSDFNEVLQGVLDGCGSAKGRGMVKRWCHQRLISFRPYRAPGGLPAMPRFREGRGYAYDNRPEDIEIKQASGAQLSLQGRVYPNRQTVWAIIRKVEQEEAMRKAAGVELTLNRSNSNLKTLRWAAGLLYRLGFDHEDIARDLGSLAEIAALDIPPPEASGLPESL